MATDTEASEGPEDRTIDTWITRFYEPTPLKLDASALRFLPGRQRKVAEAICIATERTRASLRSTDPWSLQVPLPPRGFTPSSLRSESGRALADLLPWTAILTMGSCSEEAASIANCSQETVLSQALQLCSVDQFVLLQNFLGWNLGIQAAARELSNAIKPIKDKQDRSKRSSSVGGKKSAATRLKKAKTPSPEQLRSKRDQLIAQGKDKRSIASILATQYGVAPSTIRRAFSKSS